eukprot:CAMPEP_0195655296 /NCGR_PEP_ID=MMETSP0815-20121206/34386_1 /TAXON_ID=97485 /ORGANISM="Prymnesium parvum, Strain Texoma1" /LENGTH=57 /DNA_ID=CAMNT_0040799581 /DNA_START=365 /DNA_END=535 /DNA_ORIENTATION=-
MASERYSSPHQRKHTAPKQMYTRHAAPVKSNRFRTTAVTLPRVPGFVSESVTEVSQN